MAYSTFPFTHAFTPIYPYATDRVSGQFVSEQNTRAVFRLLFKSFCNPGGFELEHTRKDITIKPGAANIRGYCIESTKNVQIPFISSQDQSSAGIASDTTLQTLHVWMDVWGESGEYSVQSTSNLPDAEFMTAYTSPTGPSVPAPVGIFIGTELPEDADQIGGCLYLGQVTLNRPVQNRADYTIESVEPAASRSWVLTADQIPETDDQIPN